MSGRLSELIRSVRACKTQAEERETIAKECATIRTLLKTADNTQRHRCVAKLLYIHMLGYPTHFGQVECLKLIASPNFPEKRIGYLGLMAMVDERHEVLMLVTNSIKQDMNNPNQYVQGLALCALGNLASPEMSRDLQAEVEKIIKSSTNVYVQKKAFLAALRGIRKVPDLLTNYLPYVKQALTDKNPSIVIAGLALASEMACAKPKLKKKFAKYVETLVKALKSLIMSGYSPDRDVAGINDPFLQVRIIRFLCLVGENNAEASEEMNDVLAQVATNTESSKNPGNAILYECVRTIMSIEAESGLRVMAINILGRFLLNRENNIRYVALNTLCQCVKQNMQAVQRHRNTIVECLKDSDVSIRNRALDLVYCLVNKSNVESLVHELISFLQLSTSEKEFRSDLTSRITEVMEAYAPSAHWHMETLIQVLEKSGNVTKLKVPYRLAMLITDNPDLRAYTIHKLFASLKNDLSQIHLVIVALWAIGEFGTHLVSQEGVAAANAQSGEPQSAPFQLHTEQGVVDRVYACINEPVAVIKQYALVTLLKLASKFSPASLAKCQSILSEYKSNINTELQARACEFDSFLAPEFASLHESVLAPMPPVVKRPVADVFASVAGNDKEDDVEEPKETPPGVKEGTTTTTAPLDLLGIGSGLAPTTATQPAVATVDLLADLFGAPSPTAATSSTFDIFSADDPKLAAQSFADLEAFNQSGVKTVFSFEPVKCPGVFRITATFTSSRDDTISQFEFKAAVPKYIRIRLNAASSTTLAPGGPPVVQQIEVNNSMPEKPLLMKIKIDGKLPGDVQFSEAGQVSNFPPGL
ncbi:unnamed protein product (mitochondrion) [Plasmodiophora brassicae]|uniref:AP-1 complex subunit gamma n=1 Tax=Plasmodiophora brassicae TaxID=37360 RepID=A0A3P3Y5D0_PLABS|nr:unnamed protein product [Plasmodiophora brassicae]